MPPITKWPFNGQQITGATNPTFYVINAQSTNAGTYSVQVSGSGGVFNSGAVLTVTNLSFQAPSLQFTTLASLDYFVTGASPQVGLTQGSDGYLYGQPLPGAPIMRLKIPTALCLRLAPTAL